MPVNPEQRYLKNKATIDAEAQQRLGASRVTIVGFGGLGERVAELLCRVGVGTLRIVEFDVFEASNLNRQLFSEEGNLGRKKLEAGIERLRAVDATVAIEPIEERLDESNARRMLEGSDCVVDCLDNAPSRRIVADAASEVGATLVHGAIAGWRGRVAVLHPGSALGAIFEGGADKGIETATGNPSPTVGTCSALQSAEALKVLIGEDDGADRLLEFNLLAGDFETLVF